MTDDIADDVNEAIEYFPGRVKRQLWAEQARILTESSEGHLAHGWDYQFDPFADSLRKLKEAPPTNLIQATHVEQAQELIDSSGRSAIAIIADLLDDGLVNFSVGDFTSSESVSKMQGALDVVRRTGRNPLDIIADLLDDGILNMSAGSDSRGVSESVPTQYLYPTPDDDTGLKDKMEAMGSIGEWRKFADTGIFQDGGLSDCRRIRHDEEGVLYVKLPKASQEGALITEIHTTEAISESGLNLAPEVFHADSSIPVLVTRQSGDFTLKSFLEHTGSLDVSPKAAFIARLCSDVREMHEGGWVHRDIKPGNITIEDHVGGQSYHGLIDFGSAKKNNKSQGESTHFTEWWCHKSQADPSKRAHYGQDWFSVGRLAMLLILGLGDTIVGKRTIQAIAEGGNLESRLAKGLGGMPDWQDYDSPEGILDLMLLSYDDQASLNELRKLGARVGT